MNEAVQESEFLVQVLRPVFELATIRVRAGSEEDAQLLAVEQASKLPANAWISAFSSQDYACDCAAVVELEGDNDADAADCMASDTKYVLLKADLATGEGEIRLQPWLYKTSGLMLADLCDDWAGAIADLNELSEEGWEEVIGEASVDRTMVRTMQLLALIAKRKPTS